MTLSNLPPGVTDAMIEQNATGDISEEVWEVVPELVDALEGAFIALGRLGANAYLHHPGRAAWEAARAALVHAGRLPT